MKLSVMTGSYLLTSAFHSQADPLDALKLHLLVFAPLSLYRRIADGDVTATFL